MYMWRRAARRASLAGQTCTSVAEIGIFRYFLQNVPVTCITEILYRHDVMSFCNVIMSLVMSSPAHMWQVM